MIILLLVQLAATRAAIENEDPIERRPRKMERDFSVSIQSLKSELKDTQNKLKTVQAELDSTKSTVSALNAELVATQTELMETRTGLQDTRTELFAVKMELVKSHSLVDESEREKDMSKLDKLQKRYHDGKEEDASFPYERNVSMASEPQKAGTRMIKRPNWSTRGRRVSDQHSHKAFSAQSTHQENALITHQTILFPRVILNEGSAYDNLTGVFTCPESGVYHFSVTIMSLRDDEVETELVVNGNQVMLNYAAGSLKHNQGTNSVVVRLDIGDKVWVRVNQNPVINTDGVISIYGQSWSTFTGFMI